MVEATEAVLLPGNGVEIRPDKYRSSKGKFCRKSSLFVWALALVAIAGWATAILFMVMWEGEHESDKLASLPPSDSWLAKFRLAAAATDDGKCSEVARDLMEAGGNAVDAAIGALLCDGVMNYHSMGLGGGFFMTIYNKSRGECYAIDAREMAPEAATPEFVGLGENATNNIRFGWKSIGIPGELAGYWEAWQKFGGGVRWKHLFKPAIDLARDGFRINHALGRSINVMENYMKISEQPSLALLLDPKTGKLKKEGDFQKFPVLADSLELLADDPNPVDMFYKGQFGSKMIDDIMDGGGLLTMKDLANYRLRTGPAWKTTLRDGMQICTVPSPSGGPIFSFFMKLLDALDIGQYNQLTIPGLTHIYHYLIEALKLALAEHYRMEDPHFGAVEQVLVDLKSEAHLEEIVAKITSRSHEKGYYLYNQPQHEHPGTAHLSFIDKEGNAVSVTSSINYYLGALRRSESTGILFNNHMADFDAPADPEDHGGPYKPNRLEPYKRPRSAMTPVVIIDPSGDVRLVTGGSGGGHIIAATGFVAARVIYLNETIKQASDAPRIHQDMKADKTIYEPTLPESVVESLREHGHTMVLNTGRKTVIQSTEYKPPFLYANSDHRKGGYPAGF